MEINVNWIVVELFLSVKICLPSYVVGHYALSSDMRVKVRCALRKVVSAFCCCVTGLESIQIKIQLHKNAPYNQKINANIRSMFISVFTHQQIRHYCVFQVEMLKIVRIWAMLKRVMLGSVEVNSHNPKCMYYSSIRYPINLNKYSNYKWRNILKSEFKTTILNQEHE